MSEHYQSKVRPSATLLAWATLLLGGSVVALLASPYIVETLEAARDVAVAASCVAVFGLVCATAGVWRFAAHADRAAGVTYRRGAISEPEGD